MEETYKEKASCLGMSFILKTNMFATKSIINNLSYFHEFSFYEFKIQKLSYLSIYFPLKSIPVVCVSFECSLVWDSVQIHLYFYHSQGQFVKVMTCLIHIFFSY